jgi:hypothetical protein
MTCPDARDAMLTAELAELHGAGEGELASHLRSCAACAELARSVARDLDALGGLVTTRSRRGARWLLLALPAAAAAVVAGVAALGHKPPPPAPAPTIARARPQPPVVSVQVARGTQATVFTTKDPRVTVVWLSNEGGL